MLFIYRYNIIINEYLFTKKIQMKTKYSTPKMTVYGSIETATQAVGDSPIKDSIIINGEVQSAQTDGSADFTFP